MPARIQSLQQYQRPRRAARFDDLPPTQRLEAEAHYVRLCARWGDDLPQWRRAILVGRAKDLVIRPRDGHWAQALRRRRQPTVSAVRSVAPPQVDLRPRPGAPTAIAEPPQVAPTVASAIMASARDSDVAFQDPPVRAAPFAGESSHAPLPFHARLEVCGVTVTGTDGYDTGQRLLKDLNHHVISQSPIFSIATPGASLPPRWQWRLELVPVP